MSPLDSYRKNMKFEYNIDPVRRLVNFSAVGRSGIGPEKRRFAECGIFKNRLLICEVREILSKIDSRKSKFGVRRVTHGRPEVIQVRTRVPTAPFWSGIRIRAWIAPLERSRKIMKNEYNIGYISMPDEGDTGLQSFLNIGVRVDRSLRRVDRSCYRLAYFCCFRYFLLLGLILDSHSCFLTLELP